MSNVCSRKKIEKLIIHYDEIRKRDICFGQSRKKSYKREENSSDADKAKGLDRKIC
jgi:hypothetical protein